MPQRTAQHDQPNEWEEKHPAGAGHGKEGEPPPVWKEWNTLVLKEICLQANTNVAVLERAIESSFNYWLRISTLERGKPLLLPVKLAAYHQAALEGKELNTSVTLTRKQNDWWLTLWYTEETKIATSHTAPVVGVDVGIANFLTTSAGKQYGIFHGKLAARHKKDRKKRRRKAKLRACLEKKGVKKLPPRGCQRLRRSSALAGEHGRSVERSRTAGLPEPSADEIAAAPAPSCVLAHPTVGRSRTTATGFRP